ncbi:MAG TPA: TrkH family potassium uptake protein [Hellea balneolensis]|uniref:TrkH family potassium uptake protein n=1 Tax=Hellea balneolensis TaxID=287478 RepID=A0A7C3C5J4_9PROT|nr:TrkH family potassium uptake protein [Hellea balneolensis]
MNAPRILIWIAFAVLGYAGLMFLTSLVALGVGEFRQFRIFSVIALLLFVVTAITILAVQNNQERETPKDAMLFLVAFWILVPVVIAIPYVASGVAHDWRHAYFEAVSAITTTGASTFVPESLPKALLFWRACVQWSGGVLVATFAVVILAALNLRGTGVHRSMFFTIQDGALLSRIFSVGRLVALVYFLIALICFAFLVIGKTSVFDALCLSLSAVSTGGLTPQSGVLANYVSKFGGIVLAITCMLGAANVSILWDVIHRRNRAAFKNLFTNVEHRGLFVIFSLLFLIGFAFVGYEHIHTIFVEAAFMASTAGFDYHVIGLDIVPPGILIAIALVGGSALSTAGGLKLIRLLLLFRHLKTDLNRMTHPSRVMPVLFQGQQIKDKAFLSIWMYFFAYTVLFGLGIVALGAAEMDITVAISACASALANFGPLLQATSPGIGYDEMNIVQLSILSIIMLFGRIEILAAFAAISPSLWRK